MTDDSPHLERAALADGLSIYRSGGRPSSEVQRWRRENPEKYALAKKRDYAQHVAREAARDLRIAALIAPWAVTALIAKALARRADRRAKAAAATRAWRARLRARRQASDSASLPG